MKDLSELMYHITQSADRDPILFHVKSIHSPHTRRVHDDRSSTAALIIHVFYAYA